MTYAYTQAAVGKQYLKTETLYKAWKEFIGAELLEFDHSLQLVTYSMGYIRYVFVLISAAIAIDM